MEVCVVIDATQLSEVATIEFQLVTNDGNATGKSVYSILVVTVSSTNTVIMWCNLPELVICICEGTVFGTT